MSNCRLDKHWLPFIARCGYCDIPYLVIAKAETFHIDQRFIGQLAGVTLDNVEAQHRSGENNGNLSKKYFSMLDIGTVERLYNLYVVDFEMFGYSPVKYYQYAKL